MFVEEPVTRKRFGHANEDYPVQFPPGFEPKPQSFGVGFTGTACSEPTLVRLA